VYLNFYKVPFFEIISINFYKNIIYWYNGTTTLFNLITIFKTTQSFIQFSLFDNFYITI